MRPELLNPVTDRRRLKSAVEMARELYRLHETGRDFSARLPEFGALVGQDVGVGDVRGAFGSIDAKSFAENLLADRSRVPTDLSEAEMLELLERVSAADGTESQIAYWVDCLAANTGDARI